MKKFYEALAQDAALAEELDAPIAAVTIKFAAKEVAATAQELSP